MNLLLTEKNKSVIFNVGAVVGEKGVNTREDVLLVQFLLRKTAERPGKHPPAFVQRFRRVPITGTVDGLTIDGIRAMQESMREVNPRTVVDGRVSVAREGNYGDGVWTIAVLNSQARKGFPETWPRLHDFDDCPAELKTKIVELL